MSTRYPSTVYSSDPALTKSGVPHPASHSTPLPHISTTTCYPSTLPNNPTPILYVADAPITPEAVGSFYFEVRVEELLPAPRTTSSSTTGRVSTSHHRHRAESEDHVDETPSSVEEDEDDNDIIQRDGPNNPPPLSDKPLTFIVGLTSDRLKMMTTMSTPGLAAKSIGYFNHQQMIYRGSSGGEDVGGIPHDDADDSENYGDVATNDKIDDCDRTYVDEFAAGNGPDQRMRLGRVACVGCLVDFNNSTVRFTKNGTAMPVAALLGHNRHRLASSLQPSSTTTIPTLIPPGHARHYPLVPTTPSSPSPPPPTRSTIYPVVCIPRNCGSQYLIHFTFMGPSSLSTAAVQHAAPLCRFPYTAWVHNEGEKAMRRQVASQTSKYAEEGSGGGGHTHMLEMIMSHFTLRGMHDVVGTLEREVKAVEEGCPPSPSSSPVQGMPSPSVGASSSNTSCGATPIRIATDRPDSATSPSTTTSSPSSSSTQTATSLHAAYNHIEKGDPMTALHILRSTNLSHLLPPTTDIIIHPPPLTGSHFLSKRWDVVYWITLLQIVIDVVGGMERDGWAQILVGAFDEADAVGGRAMPTSLPSLSSLADQAIPHAYPPPERRQRLAAVNTLLRLISSRPSESRCDTDKEEEDAVLLLLNDTRNRVRLCTVAALDTFLHDVRQQWVRMHDVVVTRHQCHEEVDEDDHPHAPTSTTSATTNAVVTLPPPSSSASPVTASSLRALVEDLRANVSLNAMSTSYPATDRPTTTNPLLPTSNRSATHIYARSVAERLGVAGWDGGGEVGGGGDGSVKVFTSSPSPHRGGIPPPTLSAVVVDATDLSPVSSQWMSCSDSDDDNNDEWDEEDEGSSPTTLHHHHTHDADGTSHLLYAQLPYHDILTTFLMDHLP